MWVNEHFTRASTFTGYSFTHIVPYFDCQRVNSGSLKQECPVRTHAMNHCELRRVSLVLAPSRLY